MPRADHFGLALYEPDVPTTITDSLGTHSVGTVIVGGQNGNPENAGLSNHPGMIVPRLGLSYRADPKTVVRAGGGITVDPAQLHNLVQVYPSVLFTNISGANSYLAATNLNAGLSSNTTQVGIPAFVLPSISSGSLPLPENYSDYLIPKDFRRGYIESWNLTVQRELRSQLVATVGYEGTHAVRQIANLNINPSYPGGGAAGRLLNTTYGSNYNNTDVFSQAPFASSIYSGLQAQLTRVSNRHGSTGLVYTFSKAIDFNDNGDLSSLIFAHPLYYYRNRALAGYDRKHNFQGWTIYNSPFGRGQTFFTNGPAARLLGDWRLSTILSRVSGSPFNVTGSPGLLNAPGNTQVADRNYSVAPVLRSNVNGFRQYINPAAFSDVSTAAGIATPRFGTSGRDSVRGPGLFELDISLKRTFPVTDSLNLELSAESFDITNTPDFANPASNVSAGGFGVITSSNLNRSLRISGRITF